MADESLKVELYGDTVGYLAEDDKGNTYFEYEDTFKQKNIEISPIKLDTKTTTVYRNNDDNFFQGLAGVFHDSLPDKFGNRIIEQYYAEKGIQKDELSLLQKLAYIGKNGMGALEYLPNTPQENVKELLEIQKLVSEARDVINGKANIVIPELMESGGSAGGARAKAIIAWNKKTNEIKSGRSNLTDDFEHYLFKFDGVGDNKKPADYTKVEYMYMKIASTCGLNVSNVELFHDRDYAHLAVKRFDRVFNEKVHMHSLCGMTHTNFNTPGIFSYEDYIRTVHAITKDATQVQFAILHMIFNVVTRNQDDHTKNFSFLMDKKGIWANSPVYDLTYSNGSDYTRNHQMSINGKRDNFILEDIFVVTRIFGFNDDMIEKLVEFIVETFSSEVKRYGKELEIDENKISRILSSMRTF
ncbi:MAG: hypothetical protein CL624_09570 [Arcobacter sp.]|nr:hypothetical protein [Arcobacter sp.]|tara:strand:+ start:11118 stop:12356 length:1239 start_codon:yes stop_codon:yes gene_type:complete